MTTTTTITTSQTFQERITERIRESIGELLTPEEAKELVNRVIERDLLSDKVVSSSWGDPKKEPSEFSKMVRDSVDPLVKEAILQWVSDNPEVVKEQIQLVLCDGILSACYKALKNEFNQPVVELQGKLYNVINRLGGI